MEPASPRHPKRHPAARSRRVVAVGSAAACVALTGAFAYQNLGASTPGSAASPSSITPAPLRDRSGLRAYDDDFGGDDGFSAVPFTGPNAQAPSAQAPSAPNPGVGSGTAAVPGQPGGNGANTTSSGS